MGDSDAELLYRWREGDEQAGQALVERYFEPVSRFFGHKVEGDPGDLIQQTFEVCVKQRDRIKDGHSFRSYLFSIARYVLFAHYRERYRCPEDELPSQSLHDLAAGPVTLMIESEQLRRLAMALRRLPLDLQIMLELRYWENMPSGEIGQVMGLNENTVRTHLMRARALLKQAIRESTEVKEHTASDLDAWIEQIRCELARGEPGEPDEPDE
ncbi:MAG: sigma-70 family RNA polymerase sigma factor [Myxococcales bacterium]|nr:sigma-70 family RNA polymerase sigma factor [Myxococcales bacterium]